MKSILRKKTNGKTRNVKKTPQFIRKIEKNLIKKTQKSEISSLYGIKSEVIINYR